MVFIQKVLGIWYIIPTISELRGEFNMDDIILYVFKKYGFKISKDEAEDLVRWFESNKVNLLTEDDADREVFDYLHNTYKGRPVLLLEEDLSHMKYLLSLLKEQTKKK